MTEGQFEECKQLHYVLWLWLADNPTRDKEHWPRWKTNGGDIEVVSCCCFMCEVMAGIIDDLCGKGCCAYWPESDDSLHCAGDSSPYRLWNRAKEKEDWEEASKAALEVANLQWKTLGEIRRENGLL